MNKEKKRFFGLFRSKSIKVNEETNKLSHKPPEEAQKFLQCLLETMGFFTFVEIISREDEEPIWLEIEGDDLGRIIGRQGATLDAIQYILNITISKKFESRIRIIVEANKYRQKQESTLKAKALNAANLVRETGKEVILEPMSPNERRIIHLTLQDNKEVITRSIGKEPIKQVIIEMRKDIGNKDEKEDPEDISALNK